MWITDISKMFLAKTFIAVDGLTACIVIAKKKQSKHGTGGQKMARLIDANKLKRLILAERDKIPTALPGAIHEFGIPKPNHHGNSMRGGIRKALRCMEQCETIDAVEVVHGRWEWFTDRCEDLFLGCDENYGWRCSNCKVPLDDEDDPEVMPTFRYCPNCGAKMDGKEN
jgi:hypothetical protein